MDIGFGMRSLLPSHEIPTRKTIFRPKDVNGSNKRTFVFVGAHARNGTAETP